MTGHRGEVLILTTLAGWQHARRWRSAPCSACRWTGWWAGGRGPAVTCSNIVRRLAETVQMGRWQPSSGESELRDAIDELADADGFAELAAETERAATMRPDLGFGVGPPFFAPLHDGFLVRARPDVPDPPRGQEEPQGAQLTALATA
jgi:hypothetical protein